MKYTELKLTIDNFGVFTVDSLMGIRFDADNFDDFYWKSHCSLLNQNGYNDMFASFNKFWSENELFNEEIHYFFPTFNEFKQIGEKLFQMYLILRN